MSQELFEGETAADYYHKRKTEESGFYASYDNCEPLGPPKPPEPPKDRNERHNWNRRENKRYHCLTCGLSFIGKGSWQTARHHFQTTSIRHNIIQGRIGRRYRSVEWTEDGRPIYSVPLIAVGAMVN